MRSLYTTTSSRSTATKIPRRYTSSAYETRKKRIKRARSTFAPSTTYDLNSFSFGPATTARVLKRGCKGSDVTKLQKMLKAQDYSVPVSGIFGFRTEQAVKTYQKLHFLQPDGIAGLATLISIEREGF